ncbi:hypothetical protein MAGNAR_82 [Mycobacterium phage Magnar]|nr:hypothetical protein MAGNAR_82 [Mycobacterium phage Magnar]
MKSSSEPLHVATTSWHEQAGSLSRYHRADRVRFTAAHADLIRNQKGDDMTIHIASRGPAGWTARVLFTAGTVLTVVDERGRRHLIDTSKTTTRRIAA